MPQNLLGSSPGGSKLKYVVIDNGSINLLYPAMTAFTDQYSLPNIFFDIGQL